MWLKIQGGLLAIRLYNVVLNLMPGSWARALFLRWTGNKVGRGAGLHSWMRLSWIGNLDIRDDATINFDCFLDNRAPIFIGEHAMIGHRTRIYTMSHDLDGGDFAPWKEPVSIHRYAVVFPNCLVMPGVTIGEGAVVLPGSVVTKDVPDWNVVGGNPARFIRTRSSNQRYRHGYQYLFINS